MFNLFKNSFKLNIAQDQQFNISAQLVNSPSSSINRENEEKLIAQAKMEKDPPFNVSAELVNGPPSSEDREIEEKLIAQDKQRRELEEAKAKRRREQESLEKERGIKSTELNPVEIEIKTDKGLIKVNSELVAVTKISTTSPTPPASSPGLRSYEADRDPSESKKSLGTTK